MFQIMKRLSSFQKTLLTSTIVLALVVLVISQTAFGKQFLLPAGFVEAVRNFLFAKGDTLSAADYKDGTILLLKPIATGVGEGRYEAGDIVEIRDGEEMFKRFGNGNFLGNEERTQLLPVYYPGKLTEEQKKELTSSEYEQNPPQPSLKGGSDSPPLGGVRGDLEKDPSIRSGNKLLKRRQVGVDYTKFLSDREIIKVRQFEKLDRLPEIDLSNIIEKKSGVSLGNPKSQIPNPKQITNSNNQNSPPEADPPSAEKLQLFGNLNLENWKLFENWKLEIENSERDGVVKLPLRVALYEKTKKALTALASSVIPFAIANGPTEVTKTVDTGGYADYLSLNAWEAGQQADLTSTNEIRIAKCRYATATSTYDGTAVTITGWTTSATQYIKIWTDPSEPYRHSGKWDTSRYRLDVDGGGSYLYAIDIYEENVRVDGLQIEISGTSFDVGICTNDTLISPTDVRISNNIIRGAGTAPTYGMIAIYNYGPNSVIKAWNNIIYNLSGTSDSYTTEGILNGSSGATTYAYNNTMYNIRSGTRAGFGIYAFAGITVAKNNIAYNNTIDYYGTFSSASTNNLSKDATAPAYGTYYRNAIVLFADSANSDFHLASADTGAKGYGTNLSADSNLAFSNDIDGQGRSGSWDIGADQFVATPIYRSVGPSNTTAIASSTGATLTISGSTATFSSGMPANLGVGDVVVYQAVNGTTKNSVAFISGRASPTSFTVKDVAGKIASSTSASTNWQIFRAYTSLANAEAGTENTGIPSALQNFDTWSDGKNLASSTEVWNIACYGDAADTTVVAISGWTTTADNYIKIYTPYLATEVGVSQRHNGKWDNGKYRLDATGLYTIDVYSNDIRIDGLEIKSTYTSGNTRAILLRGTGQIYVSNNIIVGNFSGTATPQGAIENFNAATTRIWNNIVYNFSFNSSGVGISAYGTDYVYNNTILNSSIGINGGGGTTIAKNNISYNNTTDYGGTFNSSSTNNLSKDATAPAYGTYYRNRTVQFVSTASSTAPDLHLRLGDSAARGNGANLKNDANLAFNTDIDGEFRPDIGAWDIGTDETAKSTEINTPLSGRFKDSSLVGYWSFDGANMGATTATDLSGNNNTGTLYNGVKKVPGINGQALSFDGVNDYVGVPHNINQINLPLTVSVWVKSSIVIQGNFRAIISKYPAASYNGWNIDSSGGNYYFYYFKDANNKLVTGNYGYSFGTANTSWTHLVAVVDTSGLIMYRDGILKTTASWTGTAGNSTQTAPLSIGFIALQSAGSAFNGLIDEVRLYNRVLSASEIAEQYRAGAARLKVNTPETNVLKSGLVGYWSFDGQNTNWTSATAGTTNDLSGSYATGTMTNMSRSASPVPGISGQALKFDGVDDYVDTPIINSFSALTVTAWVKSTDITYSRESTGLQEIVSKWASSNKSWDFRIQSGKLQVLISPGGDSNGTENDSTFTLASNVWSFVAFTYLDSTDSVVIYKNGVLQSFVNTVAMGGSTGVQIGRLTWGTATARNWKGNIDEVRIYNRVLSASEVTDLYRLGARTVKFKQ